MTTAMNQMRTIDLNADMGEGEASDAELLVVVSSCNIACGGHTGDAASMRRTIRTAIEQSVAIGAHPAYPDREGFGRRSRFLPGDELRASLVEQIESLVAIVAQQGAVLTHVKAHGALYNDAAKDAELAETIVCATMMAAPGVALVGLPDSALKNAAANAGVQFVSEAFVDRAYRSNGELVSRSVDGAVLESVKAIVAQAVSLVTNGTALTPGNDIVKIVADTLCIHGDTPGALLAARAVRAALEDEGVDIRAIVR